LENPPRGALEDTILRFRIFVIPLIATRRAFNRWRHVFLEPMLLPVFGDDKKGLLSRDGRFLFRG
jgi:hypothetical protein